jgi:dihydrofolate reductase
VTDGVVAALDRARVAAGDKDVGIQGGANVIRQCLAVGLVDDFQVHLVPALLGGGTRLFEDAAAIALDLQRLRVDASPSGVTHIEYRVAS